MVGMNGTGGATVTVLYKVSNAGRADAGLYNAFEMPRGNGVTLAAVKNHCIALRGLSPAGADGYHWRVRVDEKAAAGVSSGSKPPPQYSWWDIQDENAKLPVKEVSLSELSHMFSDPSRQAATASSAGAGDDMTKAATGAIRSLGKAMNKVAGAVEGHGHHGGQDHGPRVSVIAFKLLDLLKVSDSFRGKHGGSAGAAGASVPRRAAAVPKAAAAAAAAAARQQPPSRASAPPRQQQPPPRAQGQPAPTSNGASRVHTAAASVPRVAPPGAARAAQQPSARGAAPQRPKPQPQQQRQASENLMDFGSDHSGPAAAARPPSSGGLRPPPRHADSSPAAFNETRAQRLKREYEQKKQKANRVWDDIDQRWVEVDASAAGAGGSVHRGSTSAPPGVVSPSSSGLNSSGSGKKAVGIKLDASSAHGKSATVQAAVNQRVNEMKASQQKAVQEVREREMKKKQSEAQEDVVRQKLEPRIKAWSEEHGKKKQLRALLANLHTILWPGANWKQVSLGDILDANKCKRCYHKASRVVHPDKTGHLDAEQRFLAKRIFDALSQAKTEFDAQN